jgi:hypothetical protein
MAYRTGFVLLLASLVLAGPLSAADVERKTAHELLPASTVVYVEVTRPQQVLDTLLDHPLTKELEKQPDYVRALESPDMQKLREVVSQFEERLGEKWRPAINELTGDGVYVGVDLATQGVCVLVRSRDEALLKKTRETFIELARQDAANNGREDPIKEREYQGVKAYQVEDVYYATLGPWLVLTNKARLGQMVIDNALDNSTAHLAGERQFKQAYAGRQGEPTAWAYVDLTIVRATGLARAALSKKSDNPAVELLIGGILATVPDAPYVTATVEADAQHIAISTAVPFDPAKIAEQKAFYFGPGGKGAAPKLLAPQDAILSLTTYRDFGLMWKHAPDLFDDNVNAQFAEAESNLTTLFSGRSFGDDILSNLQPGLRVVVTRQTFGADDITPAIKLPAVATVFQMKNPEETARQFKITYQSLIGFLNVAGGMGGLEPLEQDTERLGKITLVSAKYLPPKDGAARKDAAIHFNASPTVAFVDDSFIIASTRGLALELAQLIEKQGPGGTAGTNFQLRIDGLSLIGALADNRGQLVAQNMLEKGHDEAAAEAEINVVMKIVSAFRETSAELTTSDNMLRFRWEVKLREPAEAQP